MEAKVDTVKQVAQAPDGAIVRGPSSVRPASLVVGGVYGGVGSVGARQLHGGRGGGGGGGGQQPTAAAAAAQSRGGSRVVPSSKKKSKAPSMKDMLSGLGTL